ncbi:MAG: hypothetical protein ABEK04_01160, partial [Candidatus Nanohalobium sp.]
MVAFLAAVIVASGCAGSQTDSGIQGFSSMSPDEKYAALVSQARNSTYHVDYNVTFDAGLSTNIVGQAMENAEVDLYSHNGKVKSLVTLSMLGSTVNTASFPIRDKNVTVQCQETSGVTNTGLQCSLGKTGSGSSLMATSPSQNFKDQLDKVNVTYEGKKTIAGRKCGSFDITMPSTVLNTSKIQDDIKGHFCVDMEKGYMARMAINMSIKTSQLAGTNEIYLEFKAADYSTEVSASDVKVPQDVVVGLTCQEGLNARVYSPRYSGELDLTVNGEN